MKGKNVMNHKLPVDWDVEKAGGEAYASSLGLSRYQRKEKETGGQWIAFSLLIPVSTFSGD